MKKENTEKIKKMDKENGVLPCYKDVFVWLILIFTAVVMGAVLMSKFYGDDVVLSFQSKNFVRDHETNLRTYLGVVLQSWKQQGRYFPVSNIYVSVLMHYAKTPFEYKAWILAFILMDVYAFGAFTRKLTGSRYFSLLAMAVVPICFNVRAYHDPLVSYHLLMQVLILAILLTSMGLLKYLKGHKFRWLLLSLVPYTLALLTYEAAYISIFVLCFLAFFYGAEKFRDAFCWRNIKRTFFAILPYFLIMVGVFLETLHIKKVYGVHYDGITPSFSPAAIAITMAKQMIAAVPFSYHVFCKELHTSLGGMLRAARIQDFAAAAFLVILSFWLFTKNYKIKNKWCMIGIGFSLLVAPALLIGVSTKYQRELYWGIGNLVVYLEYFGFTLLLILIFGGLLNLLKNKIARRIAAAVLSLGLGFIVFVLMQDNRTIIGFKNSEYYPVKVIDEGAERGIFSELEDDSVFVIENLGFPPKGYFSYRAGIKVEIYSMEEFLEKDPPYPEGTTVFVCTCEADAQQQSLTVKKTTYQGGELVVDHISQLTLFSPEEEE